MVYLDNAATTQVCPEAARAAMEAMTEAYGNPSSTHAPGRQARQALLAARRTVADTLGAVPEEVFFTSGGTEGDNWAIRCGCYLQRHKGKHIISSLTEHDAVRKTLALIESRGYEVTRLAPKQDGSIDPADVERALRPDTALVSLMLVNNETGAITDIPAVAEAIRRSGAGALLHTDAVQGYMKLPFTVKSLGVDIATVSGHKIHAPKGVGAQYIRAGLKVPALLLGGGQEDQRRSGTENMPGILAFAAAADAFQADKQAQERMAGLRRHILDELGKDMPELIVIGGGASHILCLSLPGYRSEVLLNYLDGMGICVSKGSACKRGARSHVLQAMGLPPKVIDGAIRLSLSRFTTQDDVNAFCQALRQARDSLCRSL